MISFGTTAPETLQRLVEVLERLSTFGLQLKAKKCTFMQTEVAFLGHIVGRAGIACDPGKCQRFGRGMCLTVCRDYRILPPVHPELSRIIRTAGGSNPEGGWICLDSGKARGVLHFEVLPTPGSNIGFSDRG